MSQPRAHIEVFEAPGFHDDCFRSSLWVKVQSAASESFTNTDDVSGDYATMDVTEGGTVTGAGWRRDISALSLASDEYPLLRARLRDGAPHPSTG